jgi:Cof subfamily protein (haloacid dehalogenase superfamily)
MKNIKLVATDLDGTFLRNDKSISPSNLEALQLLGEKNIVRVVATGRNLRKVREVIPSHVPFDYVIFSTGAGIYSCHEQRHLYTKNIEKEQANRLADFFISENLNFHSFFPVPENHSFWYHRGSEECAEFERYFSYNRCTAIPLPDSGKIDSDVCQFLLVIPYDEEKFIMMKHNIESMCHEIRVIRSSSPLGTGYIWIEIFHREVSKGNGVLRICKLLGIDPTHTMGIGNDYNDIDLLNFTEHSFLTDNAPEELKKGYAVVPTNEDDAFAHIVSRIVTKDGV